eukprot:GFUD01037612.1.p1 GENE.GFUD01037612.1~~GFUD01037612.1.p1  ORF type:complete len:145 (+),score=18.02 GFUD01037612.1:66-500(+)
MKLGKGWILRLFAPSKLRKIQKKSNPKTIRNSIQTIEGAHYVSNIVGSSGDKGSKKAYWEKATGSTFSSCQISKCKNPATVGGHVWIQGFQSTDVVYILPLCQKCNKNHSMDHPHCKISKKSAIFAARSSAKCSLPFHYIRQRP